jgi:isoquinoline 1-oxidoreductase subunit beta
VSADLSRRNFLRGASTVGGGLLLQLTLNSCTQQTATVNQDPTAATNEKELGTPNVWLQITKDRIVFTVAAAEMGQGVITGLATMICEELELDPRKLEIELAPADPKFNEPGLPLQLTGGSETTKRFSRPLREAGAVARERLKRAAALTWRVPVSEVIADNGILRHASGKQATYNAFADVASLIWVLTPALKKPAQYKWLGKPTVRLDAAQKSNGKAIFGMDVSIPNLRYAVVRRCPVLGGKVKSYDVNSAMASAGVENVVNLGHGVAIVARTTWEAQNGAKALIVTWEDGANASLSSAGIRAGFKQDVARGGGLVAKHGSLGLRSRLDAAPARRSGVYGMPYLAHAAMEPMNCTARVTSSACEVWTGTQVPGIARKIAREITGLPLSQVQVHNTLLGGGFGRRGRTDVVSEAVRVSKATGKPIKLMWTREDDMQFGIFRPCAYHEIEGAVDASGKLVGVLHKVACQSVYANLSTEIADGMFPGMRLLVAAAGGIFNKVVDPTSVEGSADTEYEIPDFRVEYYPQHVDVPVGAWRSVGHSFNAFVMETFIDELAQAGGKSPVEFRRGLLVNKPRLRGVLEQVVAKAGWTAAPAPGIFRGVACNKSFDSYAAAVVEIAIDGGEVRVKRIVIGIDCGEVVNPDMVAQQLEGGAIFGLSAALKGKITLANGKVMQSNFHDYEVVRMFEAPRIETVIVKSAEAPTGVGEPGVPVIAPAIANAIFAATGKRLRELPLSLA